MPTIERRTFLRWLAAASAAPLAGALACGDDDAQDRTFPQSIASSDPAPDGVLLWTRVEGGGRVTYEVATDPDLRDVVVSGERAVDAAADSTLRVDVDGLAPATTYWYRFTTAGVASPVGRTRTAPAPDADVLLRLGSRRARTSAAAGSVRGARSRTAPTSTWS